MLSIETLRTRIGLQPTDQSKDDELLAVLSAVQAVVERYCNRKFEYKAGWEEMFTHFAGRVISLERYPVVNVIKIVDIGSGAAQPIDPGNYHLDRLAGLVHFDSYITAHQLGVTYDGGYDATPGLFYTTPADLAFVLLQVFDQIWDLQAGGGATVQAGEISRVTLQGVGSVTFTTSGDVAAGAGGAGLGGLLPAGAVAILDLYARRLT